MGWRLSLGQWLSRMAEVVTPTPVYQPVRFPSWRYHPTRGAVLVQTREDERALGPGWVDTPAKLPPEAP